MRDLYHIGRNVAAILAGERVERKVTQEELAAVLGLHRPAITEIEAGRRNLLVQEFVIWCEYLHLDPADVIKRAGSSRE